MTTLITDRNTFDTNLNPFVTFRQHTICMEGASGPDLVRRCQVTLREQIPSRGLRDRLALIDGRSPDSGPTD